MMETFTSINNSNFAQPGLENLSAADVEPDDLAFYESIKSPMNHLMRDPDEETVNRILAYSRNK